MSCFDIKIANKKYFVLNFDTLQFSNKYLKLKYLAQFDQTKGKTFRNIVFAIQYELYNLLVKTVASIAFLILFSMAYAK